MSDVTDSTRPATCRVRYVAGPGAAPAGAPIDGIVAAVEERAPAWVSRIADFLSRDPIAPVIVTVYGGNGVSRTVGAEVVLPVNGDGSGVLAGLAHELVHAVAGRSPHPVLNEGLAVHTDAQLRLAGPVWPFYHLDPHRWMEVFREEGCRIPMAELLSALAQRPLAEDRASIRARAIHYLHAASLTGHLLDRSAGAGFWSAFRAGAVVPAGVNPKSLETEWLARVAAPLTDEERRRRDRSFGIVAHTPLAGGSPTPVPPRRAAR
ncbi:MAG TPA: hypothetical protein VHM89_07065 [Acidimicrobiales bacterium]|nr:hypothetical protein [Acidimicrobiales bacterium]